MWFITCRWKHSLEILLESIGKSARAYMRRSAAVRTIRIGVRGGIKKEKTILSGKKSLIELEARSSSQSWDCELGLFCATSLFFFPCSCMYSGAPQNTSTALSLSLIPFSKNGYALFHDPARQKSDVRGEYNLLTDSIGPSHVIICFEDKWWLKRGSGQ